MLRHTRKNGHYRQEGGGGWQMIEVGGAPEAAIKSLGLEDILIDVSKGKTKNQNNKQKKLDAYVRAIAQQDELFTSLHDEYINKNKPSDVGSAAEWIIANKSSVDADKLFIYNIDTLIKGALIPVRNLKELEPTSKPVRLNSEEYAPISHLLLYPATLQNMVVNGIARLFVALKADPSAIVAMMSEPAGSIRRKTMIDILAAQNVGFMRSLALMMTQMDIKDGLTLLSPPITADALNDFWKKALNTIVLNYNAEKTALFRMETGYVIHERPEINPATDSTSVDRLAFVAGTLFVYYKNGRLDNVFENFAKEGVIDYPLKFVGTIIKFAPPSDHLDIPIPSLGNATLRGLLSQMTMEELHFILHLRQAIMREDEAETATD